MDPKTLVTVILFGPLIGALTAGLFGRRIGDGGRSPHAVHPKARQIERLLFG